MQNQETNKIDPLKEVTEKEFARIVEDLKKGNKSEFHPNLLNQKGEPISKHEIVFRVGELIDIKGYTYRVGYIGNTTLLLEPVRPTDAFGKDVKP